MKYSIHFYKGCNILEKADEIILKYSEIHEALPEYVKEYADEQRIVIDIRKLEKDFLTEDGGKNLSIWVSAKENHRNFAILLAETNIELLPVLQENNINYFFDTRVDTMDKLTNLVNLGVSDIYICNELGFSLKTIAPYCHNNKTNIRVYPNVAQSSSSRKGLNDFKKFFIRPEDIDFYEEYVDIFEFFTEDLSKQKVLYQIYKDKKWLGDIRDLILELEYKEPILNYTIIPDFALNRINCGKACGIGKCQMCDRILSIAELANRIKEESGHQLYIRRKNEEDKDKY